MNLIQPTQRQGIGNKQKLNLRYNKYVKLISELAKKELPDSLCSEINKATEFLNTIQDRDPVLVSKISEKTRQVVKLLEKELKLVPKNYYTNLWTALGISVFGIPLGTVFGTSLDNMAFIGVGLPIGLVIGIAVGSSLDKKARDEDRQLDVEI